MKLGSGPAPVDAVCLGRPPGEGVPVRLGGQRRAVGGECLIDLLPYRGDLVEHIAQFGYLAALDPQHPFPFPLRHRQGEPGVPGNLEALVRQPQRVRRVLDVVPVPGHQLGPVGQSSATPDRWAAYRSSRDHAMIIRPGHPDSGGRPRAARTLGSVPDVLLPEWGVFGVKPDASPAARALLALELIQGSPGITADRLADKLAVSARAARAEAAILPA